MALIVQGGIELDVDEFNVPLNFSVADMKNPEKRRSSVSKTITLLGTSRTMRFLQVVYNLAATDIVSNTATFNFDPRTRIEAKYIEDGVVLFDGLLQVLKAIKKDGRYTFEAVLFSNTLNVVKELESVTVASLGWGEYDHDLDKETIRKAWDESVEVQGVATNNFTNNIPDGFGYIYSWFDTGLPYRNNDNDPTNQKTNDMLVGVYFREILKKCMEYVGQDYEFTLNDTELFRRLVYFNEGGEPITLSNQEISDRFLEKRDFLDFNSSILPTSGGIGFFSYLFTNFVSLSNFFLSVVSQNINEVQTNGTILINKTGNYEFSFDADLQILADHQSPSFFNPTSPSNKAFVRIRRNNQFLATIEEIDILDVGTANNVTINYSNNFLFQAGDVIDVIISYLGYFSINSFNANPLTFSINSQPTTIQTTKITALDTPLEDGDTVNVSRFLPEQSAAEWYKGFMRMFNLYQIDEGDKIKLIPAKDFYQGTNVSEDWTELIDYSEDFEIEPPNRIEGRYYNAKWSDENDYYNELYRNEIGQGYGNNVYDIGNVWQQGMVDLEVPFAQSVPVQLQGKADVYLPTNFKGTRQGGLIVEVEPLKGNKPRIFVYNGLKAIPQAQQSAIYPSDGTYPPLFITQGSNWVYPLFHHTLKPDSANPEFDVNFKYPDRVYFTPALNATTTANLWSVYWVTFINEITSADAKILTCYVKLSKLDIKTLDFSVLKNINGVLYRLNVVENYVTTNNVTTKCELIKVIEAESPQISVIPGTVIPLLPTIKDPISIQLTQTTIALTLFFNRMSNVGATVEANTCLIALINANINLLQSKILTTPNAYDVAKLYSFAPQNGNGDFDVDRDSNATRINSDGLIELVGNDVPRIHYPQLGQCPCILVEAQETNLYTYSEELDDAVWNKIRLNTSGTPAWVNVGIAPDGTQTAEKLIPDTDIGVHLLRRTQTNWSGKAVFSGFFKADGYDGVLINIFEQNNFSNRIQIRINLNNGNEFLVANNELGAFVGSNYESQITPFPNGWYRIQIGCDVPITVNNIVTQLSVMVGNVQIFAGNDTDGILAWGLQLSEDFTSYIPTTTAIATRLADVITVDPLPNTTEIVETFIDGNTNTITTIPTTYQLPNGEITKIKMT